ncbi:hypothetical protein ABY41_gp063 [Synechococcus phage ACG-2014i]|jgi:hypothetical protein|uniref:Uncharacterized protein n=1 Tax=Synechococcus phage ACG-2014i TaxID=1493513 RepID=A0A0E3FHM9_9CAUD|nr:hypothetical protein ABY41_gp063 [Synechococcus phage ACG-2014i]AIX26784.1 hypothetical protein Syn7803US120_63 [Synechococcus phage ACG-2014i]
MSKMYDNLISSAIKSINVYENTIEVVYNSNKDKEYTFNCDNTQVFEDTLCKELISVELKTGGSVGRFLHNQIKEGLIVESK